MDTLSKNKIIIFTVLGVIILFALGFGLYWYLAPQPIQKKTTTTEVGVMGGVSGLPTNQEGGTTPGQLETQTGTTTVATTPEQKLTQITNFSIISPTLNSKEDGLLFYKKDGGHLFSSSLTGLDQKELSNITIIGLINAFWSPTKDRASLVYLDKEILKGFFLIGTSSVAMLPEDIKSFTWSPDGKSFAYLIEKDNKLNLAVGDHSGKNVKSAFTLPTLDIHLNWVSSGKIAYQTAPSGFAPGFIFTSTPSSGSLTQIVGPLFGLESLWSPDASKIIISSTDASGKNLRLSVYDSTGQELFSSTISTLPEKCVWADNKIFYCAVPREIPPNAIFPDDYLRGAINTSDKIVKIDLTTKIINGVFNDKDFDVSNLLLTKKQDYLFFVNRKDGTPWGLKMR